MMKTKKCSECGGLIQEKYIVQEFEREGVKVKLSGIKADVCVKCGEIYFQPGGAQLVVSAVNSLFELAVREKQHKGTVAVSVG